MKNILTTILSLYFTVSVSAQSKSACDTTLLYSLIRKHLHYIEKDSKSTNFYILTKIHRETDTAKRFSIFLCDSFTTLDPKIFKVKRGHWVNEYKDNYSPLYVFSSLKTNPTSGLYILIVTTSSGEWGSSTVAYSYKRKKKSWKLVRKGLISIS